MFSMRLVVVLLLFCHSLAFAQVQVTLNRPSGTLTQPLQLTIEAEQSQSVENPDLSALQRDFEILSQDRNSLSKFSSGRTLHNTTWTLLLKPKHSGTLVIPGIRVGSERSRPLSYEVSNKPAELATKKVVFIEHTVSPPLNYVRSGYTLSIKLFYSTPLSQAELTEPRLDDVDVIRLGSQLSDSETRDGITYQTIEQRYLLFPLEAGRQAIPPIEFEGMDTQGNVREAQSELITFEALTPPETTTSPWLAATEVSITERWQRQPEALVQGDQLIRTLIVEAYNIPASRFPAITMGQVKGANITPLAARLTQSAETGVLVSRIEFPFQISFISAGPISIPPVELNWWDTVRDEPETTLLEGYELEVAPLLSSPRATGTGLNSAPSQATGDTNKPQAKRSTDGGEPDTGKNADKGTLNDNEQGFPWQAWAWAFIAIVCAVGWSLSYARHKQLAGEKQELERQLRLQAQTTAPQQPDRALLEETNCFNRFARACNADDAEQAAIQLLTWAHVRWPDCGIETLADVDAYAEDPTLSYILRDLEHNLYQPDEEDPWQGDLLLKHVSRLRNSGL